tara:strand:- start:1394 stop:1969 length:576 start_codon:yes stop_codon:yes gene_type:complete
MADIRKYFILKNNNKEDKVIDDVSTNVSTIVNVFTDGSSINNGKKNMCHRGGIGVYIEDTKEEISEKVLGKITNNICELKACILGIKTIVKRKSNHTINIYTDSEYVINSITKWAFNWEKNGWKRYNKSQKKLADIKNKELIVELFNLYKENKVKFIHVRAHQDKPNANSPQFRIWYGNYMADKLAVMASS